MSRESPRIKEMQVGRRTGLILPPTATLIADDGLENPETLFDAAAIVEESPNASLDGSEEKGNNANTALADFAATISTKPKIQVRFSLDKEVADQFDPSVEKPIKAQHPVRKLINGKNRDSIDTMDLSSVSTAPSLSDTKKHSHEGDVEVSRQSEEETEIASIVAAAQKQRKEQKPVSVPTSPFMTEGPDVGYDNDDDEDDLIPPPPPDSPRRDEVDDEVHVQPGEDNDVDFPNADHDDDNDGVGFEMNDDNDDEEPDDIPIVKITAKEQRHQKEKRIEKTDEKMRFSSNKKHKKKNVQSDPVNDDTGKRKNKPKKKINPYSTHFSPKGVPGPRTYTQIPLSDLKEDTPEDLQVRRSKRVRTQPLEYWRGEKAVYGGNDFGDDFDGVKNMPIVIGIARPDPTPYKKRKIVPTVSHQKSRFGDKRRGGYNDDGPTKIAAEEPFDSTALRQKFPVNDGKVAHLWDERFSEARGIKVLSYASSAKSNDLPMSKTRKKSEGKIVGKAAQSFQMANEENPAFPGYIVGHLLLPPKGIKDAESVGMCAQVFTVVKGQANSIEVAYGDPDHESAIWDPMHAERFLLAPGDNFLVPPGNAYRLRNHSTTTECLLSWTIIRHNPGLSRNDEE